MSKKSARGSGLQAQGPPPHHDVVQLRPVFAAQGDARQLQHIQHVSVAQLILQRKADEVEIADRVAAFQGIEGDVLPAHFLLHVPPGGIAALAPEAVHLVHQAVQDPAAQVGHTDLIGVRKAQGISGVHRPPILYNGVIFSPPCSGQASAPSAGYAPVSDSCRSSSSLCIGKFYFTCFRRNMTTPFSFLFRTQRRK